MIYTEKIQLRYDRQKRGLGLLYRISVIWWRSVLLVEETGVPGENHRPAACH